MDEWKYFQFFRLDTNKSLPDSNVAQFNISSELNPHSNVNDLIVKIADFSLFTRTKKKSQIISSKSLRIKFSRALSCVSCTNSFELHDEGSRCRCMIENSTKKEMYMKTFINKQGRREEPKETFFFSEIKHWKSRVTCEISSPVCRRSSPKSFRWFIFSHKFFVSKNEPTFRWSCMWRETERRGS